MTDFVAVARRIADDVLFPGAIDVDLAGVVPDSHFRLLADEGFYGICAPAEQGGAGLGYAEFCQVVEILVSGCLATSFVWSQHHFVAASVAASANATLRDRWSAGLASGDLRAGVALAGALPQSPRLWAKQVDDGYLLSGNSSFVSGWHSLDAVLVLARSLDTDDTLVAGMIEPRASAGPLVEPVPLVAAQGSDTVRLTFNDHFLPDSAVSGLTTVTEFRAQQVYGARTNGAMPLGITSRCIRLIADADQHDLAASLTAQQNAARARLDAALTDPADMPAARAAVAELAYRAGGAAVVAAGSTGIMTSQHAQRLAREATFTLVTASRPEIKAELVRLLGTPNDHPLWTRHGE